MATKTPTIEDTLDDLRSKVEKLQADMLSQAQAAGEKIAKEAPALADRAYAAGRAALDQGAERARDVIASGRKLWDGGLSDAKENFAIVADRTRGAVAAADEGSRRTIVGARRFVRQRPLVSILIAVAAGLAIGRAIDWD